ncbi:hypothetical protein WA577_000015, partial [Blastocystis sp. JDR]
MSEVKLLEKDSIQNENRKKLESILASFCDLLPSGDASALNATVQSLDPAMVPFLEKPQLLDGIIKPYIAMIMNQIQHLIANRDSSKIDALLAVLYSVIRVRGIKTAVMYFPNEVSLLSPLVHLLKQYDEADSSSWKSQYVLLYWIQLLLLSPFDISTIQEEHEDLIGEIYSLSMLYLPRTDITGDVTSTLLAHLLSRHDVAPQYLRPSLQLFQTHLQSASPLARNTAAALLALLKLISLEDVQQVADDMIQLFLPLCQEITQDDANGPQLRILAMKISARILALQLQLAYHAAGVLLPDDGWQRTRPAGMDEAPLADALLEPLSAGVDALLALLEDETTCVREKAAKALARLCAFLPSDLFASVLDATLATLHDDPAPATAHGALFTLGCFATRHILSAAQADAVVAAMPPFLLYRLHQAAAPTAVRDTACFVLWAAAHYGAASPALTAPSTLQALVLLALTDRAVNTRRAAG